MITKIKINQFLELKFNMILKRILKDIVKIFLNKY